jgi:cytosine/adenosine deaminase-related metal-dependent hydrolase
MALATRGPGFCQEDVVRSEWALARELDLPITVHVGMGRLAGRFAMVKQLSDMGLLGSDTTYVHCCYFSEEEWQLVADSGGTVSIAAQVETQMGHGWPPIMKAIEYGLRPSLSIDVVTTVPGDMFTQIRAGFGAERARVNAIAWQANEPVPDTMLTAKQMLDISTINGAHVAKLEDKVGSLTPGKRADVILLDARAINMTPIHDPVAAVTLCADVSNVDTVLVDGKVHKRGGKMVADLEAARAKVEASRDYLVDELARRVAAKQQEG